MHTLNTVVLWIGWSNVMLWTLIWGAAIRRVLTKRKASPHDQAVSLP